jgi:hypothetical protein
MLSERDFDLKWKQIAEQHEARREYANAWRDQELARLFESCGWTQAKISEHVAKRQVWVSQRLVFGRFLDFIATAINDEERRGLTERRFRGYWAKSEGTEKERFEQVARILTSGVPHGIAAMHQKPGMRNAVLAAMADGQWYTTRQVLATVEETLTGATGDQIAGALTWIRRLQPKGKCLESRAFGNRVQYRLVDRDESTGPVSPVREIYDQAAPLLDELEAEARKHMAEWSPSTVRKIAVQLRRLFEEVLAELRV